MVAGAQAVVPVAWRAEKRGATDAINTRIAAPGMHGVQQIAACCVPRVMCSCEYGLMCPPPLAEDDVEKPLVRRGTCWARRRREDEELIFTGLSTSCASANKGTLQFYALPPGPHTEFTSSVLCYQETNTCYAQNNAAHAFVERIEEIGEMHVQSVLELAGQHSLESSKLQAMVMI